LSCSSLSWGKLTTSQLWLCNNDSHTFAGLRLYREAPAGGVSPAASKDTAQPQPADSMAAAAAVDAHRSDASAPGSPAASTGAGGTAAKDASAGTAAAEQENGAEDTSQAALPPAGNTADAAGDTSARGAEAGSDASGGGDGGTAFGGALEAPSAASAAKMRSAAARAAAEAAAAAEAVAAAEAAAAAAAAPARSRARGKASRSRAPRFNPPGSHVRPWQPGTTCAEQLRWQCRCLVLLCTGLIARVRRELTALGVNTIDRWQTWRRAAGCAWPPAWRS
jgi:hypothetical protein